MLQLLHIHKKIRIHIYILTASDLYDFPVNAKTVLILSQLCKNSKQSECTLNASEDDAHSINTDGLFPSGNCIEIFQLINKDI